MSKSTSQPVKHSQEKYWAFISYRHSDNKETDREWASWLHREIERYEIPAELIGTKNARSEVIPDKIYPVFRDEESLPADADLSNSISNALDRSEFLVVLCSPRAVESKYVAQEIEHFKNSEKGDRIIAGIIAGEPGGKENECFPAPIKEIVNPDGKLAEPIAADFRLSDGSEGYTSAEAYRKKLLDDGTTKKQALKIADNYDERLQLMKLKIIAGILGKPLETLRDRDKAYQLTKAKKRQRTLTTVIATVSLLGIAAIAAGVIAWQNKEKAQEAFTEVAEKNTEIIQKNATLKQKVIEASWSEFEQAREALENKEATKCLKHLAQSLILYPDNLSTRLLLNHLIKNNGLPYIPIYQLHTVNNNEKSVRFSQFSNNEVWLYVECMDPHNEGNDVSYISKLIDTSTGKEMWRRKLLISWDDISISNSGVTSMIYTVDGKKKEFILNRNGKEEHLSNITEDHTQNENANKLINSLIKEKQSTLVAFNERSLRVLMFSTVNGDRHIEGYDIEKGDLKFSIPLPIRDNYILSPKLEQIAWADDRDASIKILNCTTGKVFDVSTKSTAATSEILDLEFSHCGSILYFVKGIGVTEGFQEIYSLDLASSKLTLIRRVDGVGDYNSLYVSEIGRYIAVNNIGFVDLYNNIGWEGVKHTWTYKPNSNENHSSSGSAYFSPSSNWMIFGDVLYQSSSINPPRYSYKANELGVKISPNKSIIAKYYDTVDNGMILIENKKNNIIKSHNIVNSVSDLSFSPDSSHLIITSQKGYFYLLDVKKDEIVIREKVGYLNDIDQSFTDDSRYLFYLNEKHQVCRTQISPKTYHTEVVFSHGNLHTFIGSDPDNTFFYLNLTDNYGELELFQKKTTGETKSIGLIKTMNQDQIARSGDGGTDEVLTSHNSACSMLAIQHHTGDILIYSIKEKKVLSKIKGPFVNKLLLSPSANWLITINPTSIKIYATKTGHLVISHPVVDPQDVHFNRNETLLKYSSKSKLHSLNFDTTLPNKSMLSIILDNRNIDGVNFNTNATLPPHSLDSHMKESFESWLQFFASNDSPPFLRTSQLPSWHALTPAYLAMEEEDVTRAHYLFKHSADRIKWMPDFICSAEQRDHCRNILQRWKNMKWRSNDNSVDTFELKTERETNEKIDVPAVNQFVVQIVDNVVTYGEFAKQHGTTVAELNRLNSLDLSEDVPMAVGSELYVPKK